MTQTDEQIAASLSEAQKEYLRTHGRSGRPHGLVRRGLLRYAWGMNSDMGYRDTALGLRIRAILESRKS